MLLYNPGRLEISGKYLEILFPVNPAKSPDQKPETLDLTLKF